MNEEGGEEAFDTLSNQYRLIDTTDTHTHIFVFCQWTHRGKILDDATLSRDSLTCSSHVYAKFGLVYTFKTSK